MGLEGEEPAQSEHCLPGDGGAMGLSGAGRAGATWEDEEDTETASARWCGREGSLFAQG